MAETNAATKTESEASTVTELENPIGYVGDKRRHAAWQTAAILFAGGMSMEDSALQSTKLRALVDEKLCDEVREEHGVGPGEDIPYTYKPYVEKPKKPKKPKKPEKPDEPTVCARIVNKLKSIVGA